MSEPVLSAEAVRKVVTAALFTEDEMEGGQPDHYVVGKGIMRSFAFHPKRLHEQRMAVAAMLRELPEGFRETKGGGWSFLNFCEDCQGRIWTGEHRVCDDLIAIGSALGLVRILDMIPAHMLPGGVPYVTILKTAYEGEAETT